MDVLIVTVLGSLLLTSLFVVLFLVSGRHCAIEQDSLLPLQKDDGNTGEKSTDLHTSNGDKGKRS